MKVLALTLLLACVHAREVPQQEESINPLNGVSDPARLWVNGVLRFDLDDRYTAPEAEAIIDAMNILVNITMVGNNNCISMVPRVLQEDFVFIERQLDVGCESGVGRAGGMQVMDLGPLCVAQQGEILHYFLHAFGFYNEHRRPDREAYINVMWDNIFLEDQWRFVMINEGLDMLGVDYDYGSIMHYGPYAYAVDIAHPTIITTDPLDMFVIGQREALSLIDIEKVQLLYGCIAPSESVYFKHLEGVDLFHK